MSSSTKIYVFSGTGNSLAIARDIAAGLPDASVRLMNDSVFPCSEPADCVGVVFPVYMWGPPLMVARFLREADFTGNPYIFAVTTFGGAGGKTLLCADGLLKKRGMKLNAGFGVKMPGNYTPMYGAIEEAKQKAMFDAAKSRLDEIASTVKERREHACETSNFFWNMLSTVVHKGGSKQIPTMDKGFWTDDKCTGCGMCRRVCPSGNITIEDARPSWHGKCEQCMACLQWCPEESIQSGKKTVGRKRYRHPGVSVNDFVVRS